MPAPKQSKRKKPEVFVKINRTNYTDTCHIEITITGGDASARDLMAEYIEQAIKDVEAPKA